MGQKLSQSKEGIVIKVFLDKYFPNYRLLQVLNNGIMYKTLLIIKDKAPLVLKIFVKKYYDDCDNISFKEGKDKLVSVYKKIFSEKIPPSIAPITSLEDSNLCGMIYRQYFEYSLKERIYLNPYLTDIEKIWISFQLLYTLNNMNELNIVHGDLNPENILLTSNLSVYISDIASYKPANINSDDIASYTYYFGSNDNTSLKGFYLAPERLVEKGHTTNEEQNSQMDVFSLGVIIAELFIEKNIFTFSSMLNYKKGKKDLFNIDEYLKKIKNEKLRTLIYSMIKVDPSERINISHALENFSKEICPITMRGFLIYFNVAINNTIFWKPDLIIGYCYRFWNSIWKMIFDLNDTPLTLKKKLNLEIINQLIVHNPINNNQSQVILKAKEDAIFYGGNKFILNTNNGELIVDEDKDIYDKKDNRDCLLIIINYLVKNMKYVQYESSNLAAMEMVKNLSSKLPDIFKLKNIIPYFVDNLGRKNFTTKLTSLNYIFEILYSFNYDELILPVTEYNYFDSFIFPALLKLYYSGNHDLILEFFNNVDKMIDLEKKFLNITLKSRIIKHKNTLNQEKKEINDKKENNNFLISMESVSINDDRIQMENNKTTTKDNNEQNLIMKKNKKSQIFKDYETSLMVFKDEVFRVTRDILGKINEIDILITCIRKLPNLLEFYGKSKSRDFIKFIINNFNKTDWIIQKELLTQIPKMIMSLGEKELNDYILLCMEMLITNNSNEIKKCELIKSIHELLKMGLLQHESVISIYNQLIPCLVHPNLVVRYEFIEFTKSLIKYLTNEEIYYYLYKNLSIYFNIPLININNKNSIDEIIKYKKTNLDRVIYQLEIDNISYKGIQHNSLSFLEKMIQQEREGDLSDSNNGDINYCFEGFKNDNFGNKLNNIKIYNLIDNYFESIKYIRNTTDDHAYKVNELISKIFWICSETEEDKSLKNKDFFNGNDSLIRSDLFNFLKHFKILRVSLKLFNFEKLNEAITNSHEENNHIDSNYTLIKDNHLHPSFYYNKSFNNWRPQGQLITTLYSHNKNPIEKLMPLSNNRICSFDCRGNAIIWKISKKDENYFFLKEWKSESTSGNEYPILFKNNIGLIDNLFFVMGSQNFLYQYEPECSINNAVKLCETKDGSNISCLEIFGKNSLELQHIILCTEKGEINIYDQRIHKIALRNKLSFDKGRPNCIRESVYQNEFYIGTSEGYLLNYDLRYNSIIKEFEYYNNDPIIDMFNFSCSKNSSYDFFSTESNSKYLIILTASNTHDIGFWNYSKLYCDLLLKVSRDNLNEVDYPMPLRKMNKEKYNIFNKNNNIIPYFYNMKKFTHIYNNNYIKLLSMRHAYDDYYLNLLPALNKIENLYKSPMTVQCISSPFCDMNFQNYFKYDNCPYIITAGNDMTIRYWDITKEGINNINGNNLNERGSYVINAPNNVTNCSFSKSSFNNLTLLQSHESLNSNEKRINTVGFSEYQNYNGITYHSTQQNEFDSNISDLKNCTKITEPAHKGPISDLLSFSLISNEGQSNILISSSWDGVIKVWK